MCCAFFCNIKYASHCWVGVTSNANMSQAKLNDRIQSLRSPVNDHHQYPSSVLIHLPVIVEWLEGEKWATRLDSQPPHTHCSLSHHCRHHWSSVVKAGAGAKDIYCCYVIKVRVRAKIYLTININCIGRTPAFLSLASTHDGLAVIIIAPFNSYRSGTALLLAQRRTLHDTFVRGQPSLSKETTNNKNEWL